MNYFRLLIIFLLMSLYSCNKDENIEVNKGQVSINKIYGDGNSFVGSGGQRIEPAVAVL